MSDKKGSVDKMIDDVSGSETRNERAWAVGGAAAGAAFFGSPEAAFVGARLGAVAGHGAHQAEKEILKGKESIASAFRGGVFGLGKRRW